MEYSTNKSTVRSRKTWNARTGIEKKLYSAKAATNTVMYMTRLCSCANSVGYIKTLRKSQKTVPCFYGKRTRFRSKALPSTCAPSPSKECSNSASVSCTESKKLMLKEEGLQQTATGHKKQSYLNQTASTQN